MKKYYIEYTRDFANTYSLYWADESNSSYVTDGMERISRKEALAMCTRENERRKYDQAFSGFADNRIYPVDYDKYSDRYSVCLRFGKSDCRIMEWPSEKIQKWAREN